jgi:ABC-type microcin C transport system permease subunit YejE
MHVNAEHNANSMLHSQQMLPFRLRGSLGTLKNVSCLGQSLRPIVTSSKLTPPMNWHIEFFSD